MFKYYLKSQHDFMNILLMIFLLWVFLASKGGKENNFFWIVLIGLDVQNS